jgi:cell division protease FtsH
MVQPIQGETPWSERTARDIDEAVRALVEAAHKRARELLAQRRDALAELAALLKDNEVVEEDELRALLSEHGIHLERADHSDQPDAAARPAAADSEPGQ